MVKIYDYYGLEIFFKNEPRLPINIYGKRAHTESKAVIIFENGLMKGIETQQTDDMLDAQDQESFELLMDKNISEIIKLWMDIFLYRKTHEPEIIRVKLEK